MAKRPTVDLMALTSEQASPMPESAQRTARPEKTKPAPVAQSENTEPLNFKVPFEFRKRFKERALGADKKLNELLFAALDAWEREQGLR